jgi:hypothetical protein
MLALCAISVAALGVHWSPLPRIERPWPARSTHAACASATHVHIVGGYGEFDELHYAPLADAWSLPVEHDARRSGWRRTATGGAAAVPRPDARMCATASMWAENDELVLFGGRGEHRTSLDDIWRMRVATGEWSKHPSALPGGGDERMASCAMPCGIVVLRTDRLGVIVYDGEGVRAQPTSGDRPPPGHSRAMAALDDRYVLVAGGSSATGALSDATYVLDTHAWHWTRPPATTMTFTPRMGAAAVGLGDGRVVLFGGATYELEHHCGMVALDDTWIFDGRDHRWAQVECPTVETEPPPAARFGASLCRVGTTLVLHGGWNPDGASFDDTYVGRAPN